MSAQRRFRRTDPLKCDLWPARGSGGLATIGAIRSDEYGKDIDSEFPVCSNGSKGICIGR
jgi:hypothetical protein